VCSTVQCQAAVIEKLVAESIAHLVKTTFNTALRARSLENIGGSMETDFSAGHCALSVVRKPQYHCLGAEKATIGLCRTPLGNDNAGSFPVTGGSGA
jgi:hypothetical protein